MSGRDLHGYAGKWPDVTWPGGARLAVSVVINFEEGAEQQVGDGDPVSERMGEVLSVIEPGVRDLGQEQIFGYGMRAGLWRVLGSLEAASVPATIFFCGRAVERAPDLAAAVTARGHEPAVHGWRWRPHADYRSPDEERADLARCVRVIQDATGIRPVGFFCRGSESAWTRRLLAEQGFLYTSNALDDDVPYRDPESGLMIVPYAFDTNDMKFFHQNGFVRSREMVEYVGDALATLLDEARRGQPRLLNIGYHLRIVGRPGRFPALRGVLDLLASHRSEIWIARRAEIARAFQAALVLQLRSAS